MPDLPLHIRDLAEGDFLVLRCRVEVVSDAWTAIIVVPGHPFLLRIRPPSDACLEKAFASRRSAPEVGDHFILRCRVEAVHGEGLVCIDLPGHGAPVYVGVADNVLVEKGISRCQPWRYVDKSA